MNLLYYIKNIVEKNIYLKKLWDKFDSKLTLILFYLIREGRFGDSDLNLKPKLDQYEVGFLKPSDIKTIASHPEVECPEDIVRERLSNGCLCFGIKHKGNITAYTWINLNKTESEFLFFPLKKNEVFLFDTRTFQAYRGKNLAPYLRYELYKQLEKLGRTNLISITSFFNVEAIKFKKKLKVKRQKLYLHVIFLKKYRLNILLKSYKCTP